MHDEYMHERVVDAVLGAEREIKECIRAREHPAAAVAAVWFAYHESSSLICVGQATKFQWERLYSVGRGCERAQTIYEGDRDNGVTKLRLELSRLEPLLKVARRARAELCEC